MAIIDTRLLWLGDGWGCKLPSYQMVPNTVRPTTPDKVDANGVLPGVPPTDKATQNLWCTVKVPDGLVDPASGMLDHDALTELYTIDPDQPVTIDPADVAPAKPA